MSNLLQAGKIIFQGFKMSTLHANTISRCQKCSCQMNSDEKVTILNNAPDAECGRCHHRIDQHLD